MTLERTNPIPRPKRGDRLEFVRGTAKLHAYVVAVYGWKDALDGLGTKRAVDDFVRKQGERLGGAWQELFWSAEVEIDGGVEAVDCMQAVSNLG